MDAAGIKKKDTKKRKVRVPPPTIVIPAPRFIDPIAPQKFIEESSDLIGKVFFIDEEKYGLKNCSLHLEHEPYISYENNTKWKTDDKFFVPCKMFF